MQTILIETKDAAEYSLIKALLEKMKIRMKVLNLSDEEKEDLGLLMLMQEVDWNETVPESEIMAKLRKKRYL
jgi:hypothetical protein